MADALPGLAKVEEAVKVRLAAWPDLAGYTVLTDHSADEAIEAGQFPAIVIYTTTYAVDQSFEQGVSKWDQRLEIEFILGPQAPGFVGRAAQIGIAHAHAALASDRSLGGMVQDLQEIDIAGVQAEGKDINTSSIQYHVEFLTPRDNWFVILGQSGAEF